METDFEMEKQLKKYQEFLKLYLDDLQARVRLTWNINHNEISAITAIRKYIDFNIKHIVKNIKYTVPNLESEIIDGYRVNTAMEDGFVHLLLALNVIQDDLTDEMGAFSLVIDILRNNIYDRVFDEIVNQVEHQSEFTKNTLKLIRNHLKTGELPEDVLAWNGYFEPITDSVRYCESTDLRMNVIQGMSLQKGL